MYEAREGGVIGALGCREVSSYPAEPLHSEV
jgi:hypothetical protein